MNYTLKLSSCERFNMHRAAAALYFVIFACCKAVGAQSLVCQPPASLEISKISIETRIAVDMARSTLAQKNILSISIRKERDLVLRANPKADQAIVIRTMAN